MYSAIVFVWLRWCCFWNSESVQKLKYRILLGCFLRNFASTTFVLLYKSTSYEFHKMLLTSLHRWNDFLCYLSPSQLTRTESSSYPPKILHGSPPLTPLWPKTIVCSSFATFTGVLFVTLSHFYCWSSITALYFFLDHLYNEGEGGDTRWRWRWRWLWRAKQRLSQWSTRRLPFVCSRITKTVAMELAMAEIVCLRCALLRKFKCN